MFKPSRSYLFYWPFQGDASFVDPFWCLCFMFVFVILSCLFLAALWSPAEKGLTSWISYVWCFLKVSSLYHMVSWVTCGTWLFRFLIFAILFTVIRKQTNKGKQIKAMIQFGLSTNKLSLPKREYCQIKKTTTKPEPKHNLWIREQQQTTIQQQQHYRIWLDSSINHLGPKYCFTCQTLEL